MSSNRKLPEASAAANSHCSNCSCVNGKHNTVQTSSTDLYLSNSSAEKMEKVNKAISNIKQRISANCDVLTSIHQNSTYSKSTNGNKTNSSSANSVVLDKFKTIDSFYLNSVPKHQDFLNGHSRESQNPTITNQNSGCSSSIQLSNVCCSRENPSHSSKSQRHFTWIDEDMPFQRNNHAKAFSTQSNSNIGNKIRSTIEDEIGVSFENAQNRQIANTKHQNVSDQIQISSTRISNNSNHHSTFKKSILSTESQISKSRRLSPVCKYINQNISEFRQEPMRKMNQAVIAAPVGNSNLFETQNYPPNMSKSQDLSKISHYTSKEKIPTGRELSVPQNRSKSLSPSSKYSSAYDDTHRKITCLKPIPIQSRSDNINPQNNKGKSSKIKITLNINVETGGH